MFSQHLKCTFCAVKLFISFSAKIAFAVEIVLLNTDLVEIQHLWKALGERYCRICKYK